MLPFNGADDHLLQFLYSSDSDAECILSFIPQIFFLEVELVAHGNHQSVPCRRYLIYASNVILRMSTELFTQHGIQPDAKFILSEFMLQRFFFLEQELCCS